MRRVAFILLPVILIAGACSDSSADVTVVSASPSGATTVGGPATTTADATIDVSSAVANLQALVAAAAGLSSGSDITGSGSCPLGLDSDNWAAEGLGDVFCEVGSGESTTVWFASLADRIDAASILSDQSGQPAVVGDLGPYAGGTLATYCIEPGFTPDSFPITGRCIVTWTSGGLMVAVNQAPVDDPAPMVQALTAQLAAAVAGLGAWDVTTLSL